MQKPLDSQISVFENLAQKQTRVVTDLPKCFNLDYYEDKIARCSPGSDNDFIWRSLSNYMLKVNKFYNALMIKLNESIIQPVDLPNFITPAKMPDPIELMAKQLMEQEKKLMQCFNNSSTKFEKKLEKHTTLQELRNYGAKCWLLYQNLTRDNFYHAIIDFKTRNANKNLNNQRNIALMYVGHIKTRNFVRTKVKDYFSTNRNINPFKEKQPHSIGLYANIKEEPLFEDIITTFNGYNYREHETFFAEKLPTLTDEKAKKVVEFYANYADVKNVYKRLFHILEQHQEGYVVDFIDLQHLQTTGKRRDLFVTAEKYLNQLNELFALAEVDEQYQFVLKDVHLQNKLCLALNNCEGIYSSIKQTQKQNLAKFKNNTL